jgi:hypothetical protein
MQVKTMKGWLETLADNPPVALTSARRTKGVREGSEADTMAKILAIPEEDLDMPLDEVEEKSYGLIRRVRQVQTGAIMHSVLEKMVSTQIT